MSSEPVADIQPKLGRKVDSSIENPIDNFMIDVSEQMSPFFRAMGFTPNGLTTISFIFGLAAMYNLYYYNIFLFAIFFLLAHLFDCMDGFYARKYNMVTDGGDKYDHFKDLFIVILLVFILFSRYNLVAFPILLIILAVLIVLSMMSVGCHERITKPENKSGTLQVYDVITPNRETCMRYTNSLKWFGPGTLILVVIAAVIYLNMYTNGGVDPNAIDFDKLNAYESANQIRDLFGVPQPFNGLTTSSNSLVNTNSFANTNPFLMSF